MIVGNNYDCEDLYYELYHYGRTFNIPRMMTYQPKSDVLDEGDYHYETETIEIY